MIIDKTKGTIYLDGLEDLENALDHYEETVNGESKSYRKSADFCPYSWNETRKMLKRGWPEGVQRAVEFKTDIEPIADNELINIEYDVTGQYLDIGAYLSGEPECFGSMILERGPSKELTIYVHSGALGDVGADTMARRGGAIMAVIEALEKEFLVDVILCNRAVKVGYNTDVSIFLKLNTLNEYSRDLLAFYVVNPAFHRRITFALRELYINDSTRHVGATVEIKPLHLTGENVVYFESLEKTRAHWKTNESAKNRAIQIVKEFSEKNN